MGYSNLQDSITGGAQWAIRTEGEPGSYYKDWQTDRIRRFRRTTFFRFPIYSKLDEGSVAATMIRDIATGTETAFTIPMRMPRWSSDGKFVAGTAMPGRRWEQAEIVICPVEGGDCRTLTGGYRPIWHADSRLYFLRRANLRDGEELWSISVEGKDEKKIMDLRPVHPIGEFFDVSPAGQVVWVQYQRGRNELWMSTITDE